MDLTSKHRVLEKVARVWKANRPQWIVWAKQVLQSSQGMYGKIQHLAKNGMQLTCGFKCKSLGLSLHIVVNVPEQHTQESLTWFLMKLEEEENLPDGER